MPKTDPSFNGVLQKFVRPSGEHNEVMRVEWTPSFFLVQRRVSPYQWTDVSTDSTMRASCDKTVNDLVKEFLIIEGELYRKLLSICSTITDHIATSSKLSQVRPNRMVMYFKVGQHNKLFFLCSDFLQFKAVFVPNSMPQIYNSFPDARRKKKRGEKKPKAQQQQQQLDAPSAGAGANGIMDGARAKDDLTPSAKKRESSQANALLPTRASYNEGLAAARTVSQGEPASHRASNRHHPNRMSQPDGRRMSQHDGVMVRGSMRDGVGGAGRDSVGAHGDGIQYDKKGYGLSNGPEDDDHALLGDVAYDRRYEGEFYDPSYMLDLDGSLIPDNHNAKKKLKVEKASRAHVSYYHRRQFTCCKCHMPLNEKMQRQYIMLKTVLQQWVPNPFYPTPESFFAHMSNRKYDPSGQLDFDLPRLIHMVEHDSQEKVDTGLSKIETILDDSKDPQLATDKSLIRAVVCICKGCLAEINAVIADRSRRALAKKSKRVVHKTLIGGGAVAQDGLKFPKIQTKRTLKPVLRTGIALKRS